MKIRDWRRRGEDVETIGVREDLKRLAEEQKGQSRNIF